MNFSGIVLDVYDDRGAALKGRYPRGLPEMVKSAHVLTPDESQALPDDVFALVLLNGDQSLRKFACVDPGNTVLSVEYFMMNKDKLPEEAQKLAASNLCTMCDWYDIEPPLELQKVASAVRMLAGASGNYDRVMEPGIDKYKRGKELAGQTLPGVGMMGHGWVKPEILKNAEVTGTPVMPPSSPIKERATGYGKKAVVKKASVSPYVDVRASVQPPVQVKKASRYALRGKYPLDAYDQVKAASAYFDEYSTHFAPNDRREYCKNMVKRAYELGIAVSDMAEKYASAQYAPAADIEFGLDTRRALLHGAPEQLEVLDKLAAQRPSVLDPELFALALGEFDKTAGISHFYDSDVVDPWLTTLGIQKVAKGEFSETYEGEYANEEQIERVPVDRVKEVFGEDMAEEFRKDPMAIYKSLPMDQRKIMMRMASDTAP